jgi:hypothetical protein
MSVRVIHSSAPLPEVARRSFDMAPSLSLEEIITRTLPGASDTVLAALRVTMTRGEEIARIRRAMWPHVYPHAGTVVIVRVPPGIGAVVSLASTLALNLSFSLGLSALTTNVIFGGAIVGISAIGVAALNALIPVPASPKELKSPEDRYSLTGWQNQATPGEAVPLPMGRIRVAPVFAAQPYSEIVGDEQYVRALFLFGYGRLQIADLRIGDTPIEEFSNVQVELREGADDDTPVTLTHNQVLEETVGVKLIRPEPVDAAGEPTSGENVETPVTRRTAGNSARASVILQFPAGLFKMSDDGDVNFTTQQVRIRQRPAGSETWQDVVTLNYREKNRSPFFRQFSWDLPTRGTWEVEVTRMKDETNNPQRQDDVNFYSLQSIRPEYPVNMDKPMALASVRIKATYQLNGTLDSFNALVERYAPDWDGEAWAEGHPRNPAALYAYALTGNHAPYPATPAQINWDELQEWHDYCETKGLRYDRDHRNQVGLREMLGDIAAAGRASPRHDGAKWGVVIDRPREFIVDHITPRNSSGFRGSRSYFDPPDALRVRFRDATSSYEDAEKIIPWIGHTGPIDVTEELPMPGKTDPDEIEIEAVRRMHEIELRRDRFEVDQSGALRVATRGDKVMLSHYVLDNHQVSGRVLDVRGQVIVLDEEIEMSADEDYAIRFMVYDAEDVIGTSEVVQVVTRAGASCALTVIGETLPGIGDLVAFGHLGTETEPCIVLGVEPGEDFNAHLILTNAAEEIETLTDAHVPGAWDPVIGSVAEFDFPAPLAPSFVSVTSSFEQDIDSAFGGGGVEAIFTVQLVPNPADTVPLSGFRLEHRLQGAPTWSEIDVGRYDGATEVPGYNSGDTVELRAVAIAIDDNESAYSPTITHVFGSGNAPEAQVLDAAAVTITGGLGHVVIALAVSDYATTKVQPYRVPDGETLDTDTHALGSPIAVTPGQTTSFIDGDATRATLLAEGEFDNGFVWTAAGGWTISAGLASHAAGTADTLSQGVSLTAGKTYRGAVVMTGRTAGSVTPRLSGGTSVSATPAAANGQALFAVTAASGNDTFELLASSDFDGSLESAVVFQQTSACAPQGEFTYHFAAINDDGIAADPSAGIAASII